MIEIKPVRDKGCSPKEGLAGVELNKTMKTLPMFTPQKEEEVEVCCGPKPAPRSHPLEKPGYRIMSFVEDFISTANGPVPRVKTDLDFLDRMGTILVRLGINRNNYKVSPGLYALGRPDADSVVLVTANYKLSFDTLRTELSGLNAWLLVLDTRGVNVWCAAGKKNFSSEEVIRQAKRNNLEKIVSHRKLILPQLAATGVSALKVKKGCGFEVIWGPIRAKDIKPFLAAGFKAEKPMRQVTFRMSERLVLTPVEISQTLKYLTLACAPYLPLVRFRSGFFFRLGPVAQGGAGGAGGRLGSHQRCLAHPGLFTLDPLPGLFFKRGPGRVDRWAWAEPALFKAPCFYANPGLNPFNRHP